MSSRILQMPPPAQSTISEPIPIPPSKTNPQISTPFIEIPPTISTPIIETPVTENPLVYAPVLEQQPIPPPLYPPQLQTKPISPPPTTVSAPQPNNPKCTTPRTSPTRSVSDRHVSEGTPEAMFDFKPEINSPESSPIIQPSHLFVFGPNFDESRINLTIQYPKIPTQSSLDLGKVLTDFDFEYKRHLEKAMTDSHSSANLDASYSYREAYRSWINSEISKMKDLGYTLVESKFCFGFVLLMKLWKMRNYQLCLPASEIKEPFLEAMEEEEEALKIEIVQHVEPVAPEAQDSTTEEHPN